MSDSESDSHYEESITFNEIAEEMERSIGSLLSIIGPAKANSCTYPEGYLKRQGLFTCKTCTSDGNLPAYLCYGCSVNCHEDHEIHELWTKRNHRCDCGNKRFRHLVCKLYAEKDPLNTKNNYDNHNLLNLYCTCNSPYDPCDPDTMYTCIMCEDWFHKSHLNSSLRDDDTFDLICQSCSERYRSLLSPYYPHLKYQETMESNDITSKNVNSTEALKCEVTEDNDLCKLTSLISDDSMPKNTFTLWKSGWRNELCKCSSCINMYEFDGVAYLVDYEDTHDFYTTQCKSPRDDANDFLNQFDRVTRVEVLHRLNEFYDEFRNFLDAFGNTDRVITREDVQRFFDELMKKTAAKNCYIPDRCNDPGF